jgi:hypothetical protein
MITSTLGAVGTARATRASHREIDMAVTALDRPQGYILFSVLALLCMTAGCAKKLPSAAAAPAAASTPAAVAHSAPLQPASEPEADAFFDPKTHADYLTGGFIEREKLTPTETLYGVAPKRDPRVTYAADVILMEQGDKAVKAAGRDGMTYSFDASAPHVDEFKEGKIVFATSRVVGRVARLEKSGNLVTVVLAPVQITDVIQEGKFIFDSDIDPSKMLIYVAPEFPSTVDTTKPEATSWLGTANSGGFIPVSLDGGTGGALATAPSLPPLNLSAAGPPVAADQAKLPVMNLIEDAFTAKPIVGPTSVGVEYWYNRGGVVVNAWGSLHLEHAHIRFILYISNKSILNFGIELQGGLGILLHLDAYSDVAKTINAHKIVNLPCDITLPTMIAGLPLAVTFHESFSLSTGFSARSSKLAANANYSLVGHLFIGWLNGRPTFQPSITPTAVVDLGPTVQGVSVGINALVMGFSEKVMVGIGAFGFNTGVFAGVTFSGSVVRQSDTTPLSCKAGYLNGAINSGVGYTMPAVIRQAVNALIAQFTNYKLPEDGVLIPGPKGDFMNIDTEIPPNCASTKRT